MIVLTLIRAILLCGGVAFCCQDYNIIGGIQLGLFCSTLIVQNRE